MDLSSTNTHLGYTPETHQYTWMGSPVPGITRLLGEMGFTKGARFFTEESRQRGHAVHKAQLLLEQLCPDATTIDEVEDAIDLDKRILPYMAQYLQFKLDTGFSPIYLEAPVFSSAIRVAGRLDAYGTYRNGKTVLVDFKSWKAAGTRPSRSSELQTAFYKMGAKESLGVDVDLRVVLKLPGGDGVYRAYQCTSPTDEHLVYCAAKVWWDQNMNNLLDKNESPEEED